jgi:hypothetical protein
MTQNVSKSYLVRRIVVRTAAGVWQHRGRMLLAMAMSITLFWYVTSRPIDTPSALAQGAPTGAASDCANTVMTAIASTSTAAAQQAYQCMTPAFQQTVSEPVFVQQLQALRVPNMTIVNRLGAYQAPAGGTLVYYAVDTSGGSVGYVVSLGPDGKVVQIK